MKRLLTNWNFTRIVRLAMAIFIFAYAIMEAQYLWLIVGGWFLYQALFNISCCGSNGCSIDHPNETTKEEINELKPDNTDKK